MNKSPLVTIAIPTFNRCELLRRALVSALAQRYENLEIVVSDNASSDGTREYLLTLSDSRLRIQFNSENLGMVGNWDACLNASCGKYFLLMSDDDALLSNEAIERLVNGFELSPDDTTGFVFSDVVLERVAENVRIKTYGKEKKYSASEIITLFFQNELSIFPCATLFRTSDIRGLGGYSAFGAKLAVDACAWISLALKYGNVVRVDEPLLLYRVHQSLSSSAISIWDGDYQILASIVDRAVGNTFGDHEYTKIKKSMRAAWHRIPIGYIGRRYKDDRAYGYIGVIKDFWTWRRRLAVLSNVKFVIARIVKRFEVIKSLSSGTRSKYLSVI